MNTEKNLHIIYLALAIVIQVPAVIAVLNGRVILGIALVTAFLIFLFFAMPKILRGFKEKHSDTYRRILHYFAPRESYEMKCRYTYYEYKGREKIIHKKVFCVVPKVSGFDTIKDRYVYSGREDCKVNVIPEGQYGEWTISEASIGNRWSDHGWDFYSMQLAAPVSKGKEVVFGMQMDPIKDPAHKSKSFLSTGIYEATEKLIMEVKFTDEMHLRGTPKLKIYDDYTSLSPIYEKELTFDKKLHRIYFEEKYPVYQYKYLIVWCFADEN